MDREEFRTYMKAVVDESSFPRPCTTASELTDYLMNACDPGAREAIQAHLVVCDECTSALLEIASFVDAASQPEPSSPDPGVERKWKELQQRLRAEQKPERRLTAWWPRVRLLPSFAAACIVLAAGAVTWALLLQQKISTMELAYRRLSDQHTQNGKSRQLLEAEVAQLRAPQFNLPVFDVLPADSVDRSGTARQPAVFTLPPAGRFALVLSGSARQPDTEYSIGIFNERGDIVLSDRNLKADNLGNLLMTFDRAFLPAGRYRLEVGEKAGSGFQSVARYEIQFVHQR